MFRFFTNLGRVWDMMQAQQMKAVCGMIQPMMDATLGHFDQHPVAIRVEGIRKMAALSPVFHDIAGRFPDTMTFQYGLGSNGHNGAGKKDAVRDFSDVTVTLNAAEPWRNLEARAFVSELLTKQHQKASYRDLLTDPVIGNRRRPLGIETVMTTPNADLVRFWTDASDNPPVYLSAPMSGHFSTLVYNVIQNYIDAGFNVYVRDLKDAAMTPAGKKFDMAAQVEMDMAFMQKIYEREECPAHAVAICQALVPLTMASAIMCEDKVPYKPATLFLASGPADISVTKSVVNRLAETFPARFFEEDALDVVPAGYPGAGKRVRAGHRQVGDFMAGNPARHLQDLSGIFGYIARGSVEWGRHGHFDQNELHKALREDNMGDVERAFLQQLLFRIEYMTDADQDAASYNDAIFGNFRQNGLVSGALTYRGRKPNLKAIDCPVLTKDASNDDISTVGQTMGLHAYLSDNISKRASIVHGKGHFWWAGGTAAKEEWPAIMAWQKSPDTSDIPVFTPDLIDTAKAIHARNQEAEDAKVRNGKPFAIKAVFDGYEVPLTAFPAFGVAA